jgi:acetyl esterase/lipase
MIEPFRILILLYSAFFLASCASKKINDIPYLTKSVAIVESFPKLTIFQAHDSEKKPVIVFIHGGYWNKGNKDMYKFLGRHFAKKGILTVIPNYTLSPKGNYNTMAREVAAAIKWTNENISKYNGNPDQIFLMGHSAGGHLIALVGTNPKYLENTKIIKGIILNDAAGLDMYSYLKEYPPKKDHNYDVTWTENQDNWKDASPINFLSKKIPPFLIYVGTKSFPSIISSNKDFVEKLNQYQPNVEINYLPKKHVAMMGQYLFPWNKHYKEITEFIYLQNKI